MSVYSKSESPSKMFKVGILVVILSVVAINGRPGPPINAAEEARRIVHMSNWASVGTISTDDATKGFPMVNVLSVADSKLGDESSGDLYFYLTDSDISAIDTKKDNKITFMFTEAQDGDCSERNIDPWAYHCMRTMITGTVRKLQRGSDEHAVGMSIFHNRHPSSVNWGPHPVSGYDIYLCKLEITNVMVYGWGGYKRVTPEQYIAGTDSIDAEV